LLLERGGTAEAVQSLPPGMLWHLPVRIIPYEPGEIHQWYHWRGISCYVQGLHLRDMFHEGLQVQEGDESIE